MAHIHKEVAIDASPEDVWDALRDWGALHTRLVPGFVTDCRLDGEDRIVTFANGLTVREVLIDRDEQARRLAWSVREGPYSHHNGVAEVSEGEDGGTRFVWTADLLPDEAAAPTADAMAQGVAVVKATLESA